MRFDDRTTTPADAADFERRNTPPAATDEGWADDVTVEHECGGDPHCWACFILPAARERLATELGRRR